MNAVDSNNSLKRLTVISWMCLYSLESKEQTQCCILRYALWLFHPVWANTDVCWNLVLNYETGNRSAVDCWLYTCAQRTHCYWCFFYFFYSGGWKKHVMKKYFNTGTDVDHTVFGQMIRSLIISTLICFQSNMKQCTSQTMAELLNDKYLLKRKSLEHIDCKSHKIRLGFSRRVYKLLFGMQPNITSLCSRQYM